MRQPALFVLALLVCGCGRGADGPPALAPYAGIGDIMDGIVIPYSQAIFDAVAYENGRLTRAPRNDDEWHRLEVQALAVAESGNLLMMSGRAKDGGDWMAFSEAMRTAAAAVAKGANVKDVDRVLLAGGELYETCTACHAKYLPQ